MLSISQGSGYANPYAGEIRTYNSLKQLTSIASGTVSVGYAYPAGDNGKINTQTDGVTGETVTYAYDALNRLLSASGSSSTLGSPWSQTYSYDGFGNLKQNNNDVWANCSKVIMTIKF
jgi:hypothetical protein